MENTVISILNGKGGTGKTTTAIMLGLAFDKLGYSVEVWDADPQGSALTWSAAAEDSGNPLPIEVTSVSKPELQRLRKPHAQVTLIDTPPKYADVLDLAAHRADLVIIPTAPSAADLSEVISAKEQLPQDKAAIALLTDANPRTILYKESLEALSDMELPVFDAPIKPLQAVKQAFNSRPSDLCGYEDVAQELINELEGGA